MKPLLQLVVLAATLATPVLAEPSSPATPPPAPTANVHFSLEMIDTTVSGGTERQVIEALGVAGRETRTHAGWKVAIPTAAPRPSQPGDAPVGYVYQDVGLSFAVRGSIAESGRVRSSGRVEISGVDRQTPANGTGGPMPQIGTFSHHFEATLLDGQATELVTVPKPDGGLIELVLTATVRP